MIEWQARKLVGDQHERRVKRELEARGWAVHSCGQGTYPQAIRLALSRTDSALRQFPDLIAARGADIVTVDAKACMPSTHTGRYAISRKCVLAGLQFMGANAPVPLFYVLGDLGVVTPAEVFCYAATGTRHPSGSYYMISSRSAHRFDEIFGISPKATAQEAIAILTQASTFATRRQNG